MKYPNAYSIKIKQTELCKKLIEKGINLLPERGTDLSAGIDLHACIEEPIQIYPGDTVKIMTGLHIFLDDLDKGKYDFNTNEMMPFQLCGLYLPRSSNKGLVLENTVGLLDCDFQGESFVKLRNVTMEETFVIRPGDRLVQLLIVPVIMVNWHFEDQFNEETTRGEGGDGSTGGNHTHNGTNN